MLLLPEQAWSWHGAPTTLPGKLEHSAAGVGAGLEVCSPSLPVPRTRAPATERLADLLAFKCTALPHYQGAQNRGLEAFLVFGL